MQIQWAGFWLKSRLQVDTVIEQCPICVVNLCLDWHNYTS